MSQVRVKMCLACHKIIKGVNGNFRYRDDVEFCKCTLVEKVVQESAKDNHSIRCPVCDKIYEKYAHPDHLGFTDHCECDLKKEKVDAVKFARYVLGPGMVNEDGTLNTSAKEYTHYAFEADGTIKCGGKVLRQGDEPKPSRQIAEREHTRVVCVDSPGSGGACHEYRVVTSGFPGIVELCRVSFQNGPIKEGYANGVQNEDLLAIVIDRLQHFQKGQFACGENASALLKLQEALHWLDHRTADRKKRGVEGRSVG